MSKVVYEGHELEHFDNAHNFRNYQLQLIKNYLGNNLLEVGPGKVLRQLIRQITKSVRVTHVNDPKSLEETESILAS